MDYLKGVLCGLTAIILAELVPGASPAFRGISNTKATGLAILLSGLLESLFSPVFWIAAIAIFALFFAASRAGHRALRIFLFWIPTLTVCSLSAAFALLLTYFIIRF